MLTVVNLTGTISEPDKIAVAVFERKAAQHLDARNE